MKATETQLFNPDNSFNAVEAYMRLVSNDNSLDANRKSYVICDNIRILATEDNSIFQELLVQASEALIELGQFLSVQKKLIT